jgi:hypothetical protein
VTPTFGAVARAVEAAVIRAGATGASHLLAKSLARAEDANCCVAARDPCFRGVLLYRQTVDLDAPQGVGILGLERGREGSYALTDSSAHVALCFDAAFELGGEFFELAVHGRTTAVVIDHRIA